MATNEAYKRGWKVPLTVGASVAVREPVAVGYVTGISLTTTGSTGTQVATVLRHGVADIEVEGITDAVELTFDTVLNTQTIIFNSLTFTAHTDTTTKSTRTFAIDGTNSEDAAEFASCVNDETYGAPGVTAYVSGAVVYLVSEATITAITGTAHTAGTVVDDHDVTYTCDVAEGEELFISGTNGSAVVSKQPSGKHFGWSCGAVADRKLTLATVLNTETIIINGVTFTAHTNTTTPSTRTFSIAGTDAQDAALLVGLINHGTYGLNDVTATAADAVITLESDADITVTGTAVDGGKCVVEAGVRTIPVKLGY